MFRKISVLFLLLVALVTAANAQTKSSKIKIGNKSVTIKGTKFNEIIYSSSISRTKSPISSVINNR